MSVCLFGVRESSTRDSDLQSGGVLCAPIKILMISTSHINFSFQELNPPFLFSNDECLVKTATKPKLNKPHSLDVIKP